MPETQKLQQGWDREDLEQRNAEHETTYTFQLTEKEVLDLASRHVPNTVLAMARSSLAWLDEDRRKAEAEPPFQRATKKRKTPKPDPPVSASPVKE
jgi:hypothetical protein